MNKLASALLLLLTFYGISSCKKENPEMQDIAALFKNTYWTGEIKYNNAATKEPFSIEFSENGTLLWREHGGIFSGTHTLNTSAKEITISFGANETYTATITNNSALSNIVPGGVYPWTILDCKFNNTGSQNLDNTTWKGVINANVPIELRFKSGNKLDFGNTAFGSNKPYTRFGPAISFSVGAGEYFTVLQPGNLKMKGVQFNSLTGLFSFEITKQ